MGVRDLVTLSTLHFCGWNALPHLVSHSASILRSSWSASQSEMPLISLYPMQSSAKSLEFGVILSGRSLMNRRKSIGPSTDPWGTLLAAGTLSDLQLLSAIYACLTSVSSSRYIYLISVLQRFNKKSAS